MSLSAYNNGLLTGMLVMVAAMQGNWLITPNRHPNASTLTYAGVVTLLVAAVVAIVWLWRHRP